MSAQPAPILPRCARAVLRCRHVPLPWRIAVPCQLAFDGRPDGEFVGRSLNGHAVGMTRRWGDSVE